MLQSADETVAYVMGPTGPLRFEGFSTDPGAGLFFEQRNAFNRIVDADYGSVYERGFAAVQRRAIDAADTVSGAIADAQNAGVVTTVFPQGQLATQLQTVAYLIASRDQLQMQRQIFFVATGGFDSHDDQEANQPGLLGNISESIAAFHAATVELGVADAVTTFTQSDFGRTLTSNGDGTDHAWGGNQFVVGGSVAGRELYGNYPLLQIGGSQDVGGGRMIPTTSARPVRGNTGQVVRHSGRRPRHRRAAHRQFHRTRSGFHGLIFSSRVYEETPLNKSPAFLLVAALLLAACSSEQPADSAATVATDASGAVGTAARRAFRAHTRTVAIDGDGHRRRSIRRSVCQFDRPRAPCCRPRSKRRISAAAAADRSRCAEPPGAAEL